MRYLASAAMLATAGGLAYLRAIDSLPEGAALTALAAIAAFGALALAEAARRERALSERLEKIEHERGEILSIASHQMRTPLTAMRWTTELLMRGEAGKLSRSQRKLVADLLENNGRLADLVNDMLSIARLEAGQLAAAPVATDLAALLKGAAKEIASLAKEKKQALDVRLPRGPVTLPLDERMFRQAVLNLLSNAIKYTPERGRVTLELTVGGGAARIRVKDTGIGIPPGQQADIFKKFYRADNAIASGAEGTGLGLYVVRKVVEQAGGAIALESAQGEGSTFTVTLPLTRA